MSFYVHKINAKNIKHLWLFAALIFISACATDISPEQRQLIKQEKIAAQETQKLEQQARKEAKHAAKKDRKRSRFDPRNLDVKANPNAIAKSAQAPLYNLNLRQEKIHKNLLLIQDVYAQPVPATCDRVSESLTLIEEALGVDPIDNDLGGDKTTLKTSDALQATIDSFVPYNSVIKTVSGASRHQKKVAQAKFRGFLRRAYLKGWAERKGCRGIVGNFVAKPK